MSSPARKAAGRRGRMSRPRARRAICARADAPRARRIWCWASRPSARRAGSCRKMAAASRPTISTTLGATGFTGTSSWRPDASGFSGRDAAETMTTFQWDDPFLLEDQLDAEEVMIRDTARGYAQDRLLPRIREAYAKEQTDPAIFAEMGALGLLGLTLPEQYGGAGASYVSYGLVAREVERV